MRRRELVSIAGGLLGWSLLGRGARAGAAPVVGLLCSDPAELRDPRVRLFKRALSEAGYIEGRNVVFEARFDEHLEELPGLAADLVRRDVALIFATPTPAAKAAKAATQSIPIIFSIGVDPVAVGLVNSLAHPEANVTGISNLNVTVAPKRVELIHELLPTASAIAYVFNPLNTAFTEVEKNDVNAAARVLGVRLSNIAASEAAGFEAAFAEAVREHCDGVLLSGDAIFLGNLSRLVALASQYKLPTVFPISTAADAGGLMSYGPDPVDSGYPAGAYAARILRGERPADLPVQQSTRFDLVINLKTAKSLGVKIPLPLLGRADKVIE
jgi:putative tryptophan/tyrosine transport system substrate-binding protein